MVELFYRIDSFWTKILKKATQKYIFVISWITFWIIFSQIRLFIKPNTSLGEKYSNLSATLILTTTNWIGGSFTVVPRN